MSIASRRQVLHRFVEIDGLRIFHRSRGPEDAPVQLLPHGFPSASQQFRRLFERFSF